MGVIGARTGSRAGWWLVLAPAYVVPVLFHAAVGDFILSYELAWAAAVFGLICGRAGRTWSLPARWQVPLVYWAAVIAVTWPIVVLREADFHWSMLSVYHSATSALGGPPPVVASLVIVMALAQLLGILLLDTCCATFDPADRTRFEAWVVMPLFVSALASSALSIYQGAVDLSFLSRDPWPLWERAAGGLADSNASGAIAAFWGCVAFVLVGRWTLPRLAMAAGLTATIGAGVWATGSRSALLAFGITLALSSWAALRVIAVRRVLVVAVVVAVVVAIGVLAGAGAVITRSMSPVARLIVSLRESSSPAEIVEQQLFNRGGAVGTASVRMMKEFPLTGLGIGGYYLLMPDYVWAVSKVRPSAPDNAQSWYRHQLANLGLVGSVGWIWWTAMLVVLVVRTGGDAHDAFAAGGIKAILVSVALVATVAGPTHEFSIALSLWIWVFWYLTASRAARERLFAPPRPIGRVTWAVVTVALVALGAGTAWVGWTRLRPPYRALWADWEYWRGASDPQPGPTGTFWWTEQESAIVRPAQPGYARIEFWLIHGDLGASPVEVKLWRQHRELMLDTWVRDTEPKVFYMRVPDGARNLLIESWVSHTWNRGDFGGSGPRAVGLAMADWTFVTSPPAGARVLESPVTTAAR